MARRLRPAGTAHDPVPSITTARRSQQDDVRDRLVKYSISMSIRTACFVLAIVTDGWLRWTFVAAAVVLPYIAVVAANAGRERAPGPPPTFVDRAQKEALGTGPAGTPREPAHEPRRPEPTVVPGEATVRGVPRALPARATSAADPVGGQRAWQPAEEWRTPPQRRAS